jgi:lysophospholipase L1-like esterase
MSCDQGRTPWGRLMLFVAALAAGVAIAAETTFPATDTAVVRWEKEIVALEALDQTEVDPAEAILFIGSSSIRLWDTLAADLKPWPVIRRGYGGARYRDLCHFASRLVAAHDPRGIVVFVANDITSPTDSPSAEQVMLDVRATLEAIRACHPAVPVLFVAVTPTESRWKAWPQIEQLNEALAGLAATEPETCFIATADRFLDPATGRPNPSLFQNDKLHLSPAGYRIWAELISAALEAELGAAAGNAAGIMAPGL